MDKMNEPLQSILYTLIPEEVKPNINDALSLLGRVYNSETPDPLLLDFNDPTLKHAYIYRYFICISNAIRECWTMLTAQKNVDFVDFFRTRNSMNVCCVGGGPGTDLVGFCQFLEECNIQMKLNVTILDRYDWSEEAKKVLTKIDSKNAYGIADFQYFKYDLFEKITPEVEAKIKTADLVTVVKFLSAVVSKSKGLSQFENLLSLMELDTRLFFMDNSGGGSNGRMHESATDAGFMLVGNKIIDQTIKVFASESELLGNNRLPTYPQMSTSVSASLWKKTDHSLAKPGSSFPV